MTRVGAWAKEWLPRLREAKIDMPSIDMALEGWILIMIRSNARKARNPKTSGWETPWNRSVVTKILAPFEGLWET